ncbi:hypothetical protein DL764_003965 [Monosporascus ibericus]|uniref:Uncharacterized protein n=1 Tax=Monosporascus ibericus TaxID=155417 RepID=A0A4Q4TEI3_9PEZI|nr:hypothetical protein DL764_003965 [Monosporascus ibericus]
MATTRHQPQQQPGGLKGPVTSTNTAAAATPYSTSEQPPRPRSKKSRRHSLPFVFPPLCQPNTSSTSILPNTAEGRPIPLDGNTAAHRTSALRELNRSQPVSRHGYTKSNGTPSTTSTTTGTYSQPVIVRTYSGPPPSSSANRRASRRVPLSTVSATSNASNWRQGWNGIVPNMARQKEKRQAGVDAKLPPLEAFSFKSIMADMQQDIGADLDRIAEICARSRYSLSNQYEVHVAPHGSGAGFLRSVAGPSRHNIPGGPTLQAISSDDEHSSTRHKKRRGGGRRRSAAYGTLETIMSSSRSSDEEKGKKKSASEIAEDVRGRAARPNSNGSRESPNSTEAQASSELQGEQRKVVRRKSPSFANAVLDSSRSQAPGEGGSPRTLGTGLVSGPARPKTSRNHLEIRTSPDDTAAGNYTHEATPQPTQAMVSESVASAAIANPEEPRNVPRLLSGFSSWMPWVGGSVTEIASSDQKAGKSKSYAEGTLRELLLKGAEPATDQKGKCIERMN